MVLKKLYRLIFVFLIIGVCIYNNNTYIKHKNKVDNIINSGEQLERYDGHLYIPKFNYRGLIKEGESKTILDSNYILLLENGSNINDETGNIVLAGHNNKYVFSILYKLNISDEIIIYEENNKYTFQIYELKTINITDTYILDNIYDRKIITLITCTSDNQKRYILRGILKSHNFT